MSMPWADIATRYGMDSPGIGSRCGRAFMHPSGPTLGPTHNRYRISFPGGKRPGPGIEQPFSSSVEVTERVELHL